MYFHNLKISRIKLGLYNWLQIKAIITFEFIRNVLKLQELKMLTLQYKKL